jgi:hypothetical protein
MIAFCERLIPKREEQYCLNMHNYAPELVWERGCDVAAYYGFVSPNQYGAPLRRHLLVAASRTCASNFHSKRELPEK